MNAQELPVVTPHEARSSVEAGEGRGLCICGCGRPPRLGSKYAQTEADPTFRGKRGEGPVSCRQRLFELQHPRLDLSGVDAETCLRIKRMVEEAVRAAKEGMTRATVDASHPVKRERDPRPSCRLRLSQDGWEAIQGLAEEQGHISASELANLIFIALWHHDFEVRREEDGSILI